MRSRRLALTLLLVGAVVVACTRSDLDAASRSPTSAPDPVAESPNGDEGDDEDPSSEGVRGSDGVGDEYYPGLGNGGYEVLHYDLELDWLADDGVLEGVATLTIRATDDLDTFNLDLVGLEVHDVVVDGQPAPFERDGRELTMDPDALVENGSVVEIVVTYGGQPEQDPTGSRLFDAGWHTLDRHAYVASEPAGAATWFPANDHPIDKATFSYAITVPADLVAIANGVHKGTDEADGTRTFRYEMTDPMATYLASVVIGDLVIEESVAPNGVPIRDAYPPDLAEVARASFARTGDMLIVFEDWFGPYPYEVYGHVVVDTPLGFALENQTLSLFGSDLLSESGRFDDIVAHELAHQWFGNSVSPAQWRDIWLNEGFATYAEWVWSQESGGPTIADRAADAHVTSRFTVPPGDPGPDELFHGTVYRRGALALYALSETIGDGVFRQVLHEWATRFAHSAVTTADLQALAEELSGQDLDGLFADWVYGEELPDLP